MYIWNPIIYGSLSHFEFELFLQYFLNPKVAKEPVPPQLELIAKEILVPLLSVFHHLVERVAS